MNKIMQRYKHDSENGVHGDCWAACIATITGIPLEEIPDPNAEENKEWSKYWVNMWQFLQDKGLNIFVEGVHLFNGKCEPVIAIGKSPRGEWDHAVVWQDGIIHDPHPDNTGIHTIEHFEIIDFI